jgi:hypothetical protein
MPSATANDRSTLPPPHRCIWCARVSITTAVSLDPHVSDVRADADADADVSVDVDVDVDVNVDDNNRTRTTGFASGMGLPVPQPRCHPRNPGKPASSAGFSAPAADRHAGALADRKQL